MDWVEQKKRVRRMRFDYINNIIRKRSKYGSLQFSCQEMRGERTKEHRIDVDAFGIGR